MHQAGAFELKHADVPAGADQPWSGHRTPRDAAERTKHAFDAGIHGIKLKYSLEDDAAEWARLIRDACEDVMRIILDPNERWEEFRHATNIATELEKVGNVLCIEDPLPRGDLGACAELRAHQDAGGVPRCLGIR